MSANQWHTDEAYNYIANTTEQTYEWAMRTLKFTEEGEEAHAIETWARKYNIVEDEDVDLDLVDWQEVAEALTAE